MCWDCGGFLGMQHPLTLLSESAPKLQPGEEAAKKRSMRSRDCVALSMCSTSSLHAATSVQFWTQALHSAHVIASVASVCLLLALPSMVSSLRGGPAGRRLKVKQQSLKLKSPPRMSPYEKRLIRDMRHNQGKAPTEIAGVVGRDISMRLPKAPPHTTKGQLQDRYRTITGQCTGQLQDNIQDNLQDNYIYLIKVKNPMSTKIKNI